MSNAAVPPVLSELAAELGVATSYEDYLQRRVDVGADAVRLAMAVMGIDAATESAARAALAALRDDRASRALPASIVTRTGEPVEVAAGSLAEADLLLEDGGRRTLPVRDGVLSLPADLPLGYHQLHGADATAHLIVSPGRCPLPLEAPSFGWMAQLYAARSRSSWGLGDYADLATLAEFSGEVGAAMILVNPLHAPAPVVPQVNSPYSPTSRRYRSPLYLRIEQLPELTRLGDEAARHVASLAAAARASGRELIDRDAVFHAKTAALELLFDAGREPGREATFRAWCEQEGTGLVDFATFCVLAEQHGTPWQEWPSQLHHPGNDAVRRVRDEQRHRVEFHMWQQWLCDTQLQAAQTAGINAGMSVGIIHDLAVGVDPGGADAWALQDELATGVTVGAPPDGFNQKGQDWALPPLLPARLPLTGFGPFRDMLRSVLHHAGGIRIDHVMGLWRLWWVPQGRSAAEGTYVSYPARDLLAVLALEAHRAGAMVVGEDLGTVQKGVREAMAEHRVLSSRVLYFERVNDDPDEPMLPAAEYPELALTSITTHDLPTPAGWWADEEIRVQTELDLFGSSTTPEEQAARKAAEREDMLRLLRSERLVGEDSDDDERVLAMHTFLARTPSLLVATALGDAIGDRRQPNMPGTTDAYPNWRLPLSRWTDHVPEPIDLEDLVTDRRLRRIADVLRARGPQESTEAV